MWELGEADAYPEYGKSVANGISERNLKDQRHHLSQSPLFTVGKTEAQGQRMICPKLHSKLTVELHLAAMSTDQDFVMLLIMSMMN